VYARQVKAFGCENRDALTDEQREAIDKKLSDAIELVEQGRATTLDDAHILLNYEAMIAEASEKGAKGAIDHITQGTVATVKSGGDAPPTGYEAYQNMSPDKLASVINDMPDEKAARFLKEAPASLRKKYPAVPWD
jgi:hypothetical protein